MYYRTYLFLPISALFSGDPLGIFTLWLYVFETQMLSKLLKSYRNDLVTISKMLICLLMTPLCLLNFPGSKLQLSF